MRGAGPMGLGVRTLTGHRAGEVIDRFAGMVVPHIVQHSLQLTEDSHISQTRFVGFLAHGCAPNSRLDMEQRELIAQEDIPPGDWLTIDYAATEDRLFRQFACVCGAPGCRRWITGRKERPDSEGLAHLQALASATR